MKALVTILTVLLVLVTALGTLAADTKVSGRLFADWNIDLSDGADNANSFNVTRTYIDVTSKLSDYTSARFTLDLRSVEFDDVSLSNFHGYTMILKYGYLDWSPKFSDGIATLRFGLHPTPYIDMMNKLWGRRYVDRTAGDKYVFLTTSDVGASVIVGFGEKKRWGYGSLSLFNGTRYTGLDELNKQKDFNAFVFLTPLVSQTDFANSAVQAQFYTGTQNKDFSDTTLNGGSADFDRQLVSVGGNLAYREIFTVGGDLNFYSMGKGAGVDDLTSSAHSVFGTVYLGGLVENSSLLKTLNLYGRFDIVDPNTDLTDDGRNLIITGVECVPYKGVKTSINFRQTSYQESGKNSKSALFVNWLIQI